MQFLHMGDWARIIKGSLCGGLGKVISTDHTLGTVCLELAFDGHLKEIEIRLLDIEHVFQVSDSVRVVASSYLGLEGHIIQMCGDTFHLCQHATNEQVEVSKYYLDRRQVNHTMQSQLLTQQHFEPPELDSIQIGDFIEVLKGEHMGKRGVVNWFAKGDDTLWFRDIFTTESIESSGRLLSLSVPVAIVQWTNLTATLQYMKERGYDVRPGDVVTVIHGPEYEVKGVVQSINVPIGFVMKVHNANLDRFKKDFHQEVYIIGGDHTGYRAMLHNLSVENCTVALREQKYTTVKLCDVVTKYGMRLNGAMLEGPIHSSFSMWSTLGDADVAHDASSSVNPNSSTSNPWTVNELNTQDNINARAETDNGPLAWLMSREFCLTFFTYHAMLKVSPIFDASLSKRFVSTPCPDPFCGENGPTPEGCVAAYCTSNNAGAKIKHYHIPATYLSPAPPYKKNQECFILDGAHCSLIRTVAKCNTKNSLAEISIMPTVTLVNDNMTEEKTVQLLRNIWQANNTLDKRLWQQQVEDDREERAHLERMEEDEQEHLNQEHTNEEEDARKEE
ncbi:hypothetical protein F4604DRAFT_1679727 [Suillus subluteus]|nr:hypothetical protein F4604DRAFT_1679727 [Suillus subluteus]